MCHDILEQHETETNLLKRIVTGNELWIFQYEPFPKQHSLQLKIALSPRRKKTNVFKIKVMLITFNVYGIIHV